MRTNLVIGLSGLLALGLTACGSSAGNDDLGGGGGTPDGAAPQPDAYIPPAIDTAPAPVDVAGPDPYVWVVVQDTEQKACSTNGPGVDIDAVALWSGAGALGWGKLLSANYYPNPLGNACENAECTGGACKYSAIGGTFTQTALEAFVEGPKDAMVMAVGNDSGYFSLNGGTLQIQIGDLAGGGPAVALKKGDKIKVFEVDKSYITSGDAPATCSCLPEHFTVSLQTATPGTAPLVLKPTLLDAGNTTCAALTAASTEGCGSTVFMVP